MAAVVVIAIDDFACKEYTERPIVANGVRGTRLSLFVNYMPSSNKGDSRRSGNTQLQYQGGKESYQYLVLADTDLKQRPRGKTYELARQRYARWELIQKGPPIEMLHISKFEKKDNRLSEAQTPDGSAKRYG
jgi:hypothetical protein